MEDEERLAMILTDGEGRQDEICCVDYFKERVAVRSHAALMKELEQKEDSNDPQSRAKMLNEKLKEAGLYDQVHFDENTGEALFAGGTYEGE